MQIQEVFNNVISQLSAGKRPLLKLSEQDIDAILNQWDDALRSPNKELIIQILCILDNSVTLSQKFYNPLMQTLKELDDDEVIVLTLGVCRKQVIDEHHKRSQRLPMDFLNILKTYLNHNSPEVIEWALRLIESLGAQAIILKPDVLASRPGFTALFNKHKKNVKQIIELLERRWS